MIQARLFFKDNPAREFRLSGPTVLVGRSPDCNIVIPDPYVSRKQLLIILSENGASLKNVGSNPVKLEGRGLLPGQSAGLKNRDEIEVGRTSLVFSIEGSASAATAGSPRKADVAQDEKTVLLSTPGKARGPAILVSPPSGADWTVELDHSPVTIGRAGDADIRLSDRTVSRHHAVIERRDGGFYIKGVSKVNPVLINGRKAGEARLYSGDQVNIGVFSLSFLSDDRRDLRPRPGSHGVSTGRLVFLWALAALLMLAAGSYLFYFQVYRPWTIRNNLKEAEQSIQLGDTGRADRILEKMLSGGLPGEYSARARKLLSQSILVQAEKLSRAGDPSAAERLLISFLKKYGAGPDAQVVWDNLDRYRIEAAKKLEHDGKLLAAMKKYSMVEKESPYYDEAQKQISRIWLAYQKEKLRKQTVYQLMQEAEQAFREGRYLAPVNHNAYAAYQAILSIDPSNQLARKRIQEILDIFRKKGEEALSRRDYQEALGYFERYLLVNPDDQEVKEQASLCREQLAGSSKTSETRQKERVRKLLKESGAESSWIMKYLFEDEKKKDEKNKTETPW